MMTYLGIIEQRTNELLQLYRASQAPESLAPVIGPTTPAGKGAMALPTLPSTGIMMMSIGDDAHCALDAGAESDDSEEGDSERPMTIDELKRRSMEVSSAKKLATSTSSKRKSTHSRA